MGDTIWVLKEGQDHDEWDHSFILGEDRELNRLSKKLGVKQLDELLDYSILNEEFGDSNEEPNYLNPCEVRPTLVALISEIKSGQSRIRAVNEILEELEDCLKKVIDAENKKCTVRLSVVR